MRRPAKTATRRATVHKKRTRPTSGLPPDSPWFTIQDAAGYGHVSDRLLRKEIKSGRLRAATVGGRKQILMRREWIDSWIENQAAPMPFPVRSRVG